MPKKSLEERIAIACKISKALEDPKLIEEEEENHRKISNLTVEELLQQYNI